MKNRRLNEELKIWMDIFTTRAAAHASISDSLTSQPIQPHPLPHLDPNTPEHNSFTTVTQQTQVKPLPSIQELQLKIHKIEYELARGKGFLNTGKRLVEHVMRTLVNALENNDSLLLDSGIGSMNGGGNPIMMNEDNALDVLRAIAK